MRADVGSILLGITITALLVAWALGWGVLGGRVVALSEPLKTEEPEPADEAEVPARKQ